jgi:GT2 family glycosyltransferase
MKVTACVVSWNTVEHLPGALDSLLAQTHPDLEVVVIDNASADGSLALVRSYPDVRLVANDRNLGYAGAANQGIALAQASGSQAFLVCNPDVVLEPGYVTHAVEALSAHPRRASVQGKLWRTKGEAATGGGDPTKGAAAAQPAASPHPIIDTTGHVAFRTRLFRNRGEGTADVGQFDDPGPVFGVSGAVAMYSMNALDDVACDGEIFDEDLFAFWEDVDLDWRLQLRGFESWYTPAARGWHQRGGAGPRRSALVERLNFTNRFLVVLKDDDAAALARAFPGFATTSVLKAGELALTVPSAFVRSAAAVRLVPLMLAKRRLVHARATVDPAEVVATWFEPFDYGLWISTWWRRVRVSERSQPVRRLPEPVSGTRGPAVAPPAPTSADPRPAAALSPPPTPGESGGRPDHRSRAPGRKP